MQFPQGSRRGATLATTLVVCSLLFTVALVAAGTSVTNLGCAARLEAQRRALNLADAAASTALAQLQANPEQPLTEPVRVTLPGDPEGACGRVVFTPQDGLPVSTCNLQSGEACPGWQGTVVPGHAVQLMAVGRCGDVERRVRLVVGMPAYPFVLASDGPVVAEQGVVVGSLTDAQSLRPGDVACNSLDGEAVRLGPDSLVTGDLDSTGGIVLDPAASVKGQTRPYSDAHPVPRVDLDRFDPARQGVVAQALPGVLAGQTLTGTARVCHDLWICGDLTLDGGSLYVPGSLEVQGALRGTGLVVVRGKTTVHAGTCLAGAGQAVLLCSGDVQLSGQGTGTSSFHGLVYTEGTFRADQVSLVGAFIAQGARAGLELRQTKLVHDPTCTSLQLEPQSVESTLAFSVSRAAGEGAVQYVGATVQSQRSVEYFAVDVQALPAGRFVFRDALLGRRVEATGTDAALEAVRKLARAHALALGYSVAEEEGLGNARALGRDLGLLTQQVDATAARAVGLRGFDLNEFLSPQERLKILLRSEW